MTTEYEAQERQIIVLTTKVDSLTEMVRDLARKFDGFSLGVNVFQKDYYVEHQKVVSTIADLIKDMQELSSAMTCLEAINNDIKTKTSPIEDVKSIKQVLYGNGQPGVVAKVDKMQEWIANQVWFQRLVISALVGQAVIFIIFLLKNIKVP